MDFLVFTLFSYLLWCRDIPSANSKVHEKMDSELMHHVFANVTPQEK